jgi:hypothetical protein
VHIGLSPEQGTMVSYSVNKGPLINVGTSAAGVESFKHHMIIGC